MFDDDVEDYFVERESEKETKETPSVPLEQERQQNSRVIDFGQPDLGSQEQPQSHETENHHSNRFMSVLIKMAIVAILVLGVWGYFRYFSPVVDSAVMDVYVENVQRRGVLFKTFEAQLTEKDQPVGVSIADETTFYALQEHQSSGQKIRVRYCKYVATLPWRGESEIVIVGIVER